MEETEQKKGMCYVIIVYVVFAIFLREFVENLKFFFSNFKI